MLEKSCNFDLVRKHGTTITPLFDLGVDFKVFMSYCMSFEVHD
jgi:hypothetical protein